MGLSQQWILDNNGAVWHSGIRYKAHSQYFDSAHGMVRKLQNITKLKHAVTHNSAMAVVFSVQFRE